MSSFANQGRATSLLRLNVGAKAVPTPEVLSRTRTAALQYAKRQIEDFTHSEFSDVLKDLGVDANCGLSTEEARSRLERHGPNELIQEENTPLWKLFLEQFSDPLVILLIFACIGSMALQQWVAGSTIIVIVMMNAYIGATMEFRAAEALDELEKLTADNAIVRRDGVLVEVESQNLVPGDIIILDTGATVPADLRLIETQELSSDEASLTGESVEVKKNAKYVESFEADVETGPSSKGPGKEKHLSSPNMVFMNCTVQDGRGVGVVVKTGMDTRVGTIAAMLQAGNEDSSTPLQRKLAQLGVYLGIASLVISMIVFVAGMITGNGGNPDSDNELWLDLLLIAVSLTVAAVPEGLPAAVTVCLALGMKRMVKKDAVIKNLHSVETLGSATIICSDKTGTLTCGQMTAVRVWRPKKTWKISGLGMEPVGEFSPIDDQENARDDESNDHKLPLVCAVLCSNAQMQKEEGKWVCIGNSSEIPLVVAAVKANLKKGDLDLKYSRIRENPFNSIRKMMSCIVKASDDSVFGEGNHVAVIKGAPGFVLDKCTKINDPTTGVRDITDSDRDEITHAVDRFSEKAYRVLAMAYRTYTFEPEDLSGEGLEQDLVFAGMVASIDPERSAVIPSIQECYGAGIRVVMITGDYVKTAKAIAENIKLLPPNSSIKAAVDCEVLRGFGEELFSVNTKLDGKGMKGDEKKQLLVRKSELEAEIDAITDAADVYARAKPQDKITIVKSFQRKGNVVSMTGDGVNDAPALNAADIGVAMGITGTGVAQGAADMILTTDDFVSIVKAVEEGRTIYANIGKFCYYLLSTNVSEVFFVLIAVLIGYPSPLTPVQILWLNLVTDGAPAIALAVEPTEEGTMTEGPRSPTEPLIEKLMITGIVIQTVVLTTITVVLYVIGYKWHVGQYGPLDDDDYSTPLCCFL